jgi:hypothetical protein
VFDYPGAILTIARGINDAGIIVGVYEDAILQGFSYDGNNFTSFSYLYLSADINNNGDIVGGTHGSAYLYDGSTYSVFDYPGAKWTVAQGINDASIIVGQYNDGTSVHSYLYDGNNFTSLNYRAWGINNNGDIVGGTDSGSAFVATVVPEPVRIWREGLIINYYTTLQTAYDDALEGDIIQSQGIAFNIALFIDDITNKTVSLEGGYNNDFSSITGKSTIDGHMAVSNGTLIIDNGVLELK